MPKRILLADDSITIQKVVELTFSDGDYEVIATNNGTKAIQRLAEVKPDIVLSDIIMPEKNGYEVCEYVKSHPEFRHIPVILLTGTFEPFDPDRAEKAGCDAVVTKPFESQSLIHKVEELIQQSRNSAAPPPMFEPSQSVGTMPTEGVFADHGFGEQSFGEKAFDEPPASQVPAWPPLNPASSSRGESMDDSPFAPDSKSLAGSSEFEDSDPFAPSAGKSFSPEPSFRSHGEELFAPDPKPSEPSMPFEKPQEASSRFGSGASDSFAGEDSKGFSAETRAFPKMSYEDMKKLRDESLSTPPPSPASSSASSGSSPAWPEPDLSDEAPTGRWPAPASKSTPTPFSDSPSPQAAAPRTAPPPAEKPASAPFSFDDDAETPAASSGTEQSPFAPSGSFASEPSWAPEGGQPASAPKPAAPTPTSRSTEQPMVSASFSSPSSSPSPASSSGSSMASKSEEPQSASEERHDFTEAEIDRIARRVIELMSDQVVRNIAWEVIPDLAEIVVRERIKELEQETN